MSVPRTAQGGPKASVGKAAGPAFSKSSERTKATVVGIGIVSLTRPSALIDASESPAMSRSSQVAFGATSVCENGNAVATST